MNIEAEIIELDMEFQNYSTSIKISTVRNYDKSFGKIFSNIFLLAGKTSRNDVNTKAADNEATKGIVEAKENQLGQLGGGANVGSGSNGVFDSLELSNNTFIALGTNTLTNQIPAYYDQTKTRGVAQITNGGIYVRDFSNNMRIKINSSEGFVGLDKFGAETFRVDLDGFSSISMNQFTRGFNEDGIFLGSTKTDPIPEVLTVSSPGSADAISVAPSTGDKFFFKSGVFFSQSLKIGDLVRFTNDNSVMYGFIKTFYTSSPNHIEVKVTKVIGTTAYAS